MIKNNCQRSEECEYTMILQTIMLTNVLIYNDSYVCSSILYVRTHPSDNDSMLQLPSIVTGFCTNN